MDWARDRRRHERFTLPHGYARISVRPMIDGAPVLDGHAYDVSRGGVRFELDSAIKPGTPVAMCVELPHASVARRSDRVAIFAFANVVWLEDEDDAGPQRMAAAFTRFARESDEQALSRHLFSGRYARAA